jgi:glycosyltransferase involved in cell wall biosynthesis
VAEGFGLSAVESVVCGTPVLCSDAGNLPQLLPEGHGVFVVERAASASEHAAACLRALESGNADCVARGAPYVSTNYGADRMIDAYVSLLEEVQSRRRSVRKSDSS